MVGIMIILTILALLIALQALLAAINVAARLLWGVLALTLIYLVTIQLLGR